MSNLSIAQHISKWLSILSGDDSHSGEEPLRHPTSQLLAWQIFVNDKPYGSTHKTYESFRNAILEGAKAGSIPQGTLIRVIKTQTNSAQNRYAFFTGFWDTQQTDINLMDEIRKIVSSPKPKRRRRRY